MVRISGVSSYPWLELSGLNCTDIVPKTTGNRNLVRVSGSSSYLGLELPR